MSSIHSFPTITNQILDSEFLRRLMPLSPLWGNAALSQNEIDHAEVDVISGADLMIRRDVFEAVGGFTSEYFMYAEDVDLCWKVAQKGWKVLYVKDARVYHHGGGSTSENGGSRFASVMMRESIFRFLKRSKGAPYAGIYRLGMSANSFLRLGLLLPLSLYLYLKTRRFPSDGLTKWSSVLRWSLGSEKWVSKYFPVS